MTTFHPSSTCSRLATLWPAPVRFAAVGADGTAAGSAELLARARALATPSAGGAAPSLAREGSLVVASAPSGELIAADAPGAPVAELLEHDLRRALAEPA
jgi:hypothetical protein